MMPSNATTAIEAAEELTQKLSGHATEFDLESDSDEEEAVLHLTLATDSTGNDYLNKPNSGVCLGMNPFTDEDSAVVVDEFDIRVGTHDKDTVQSAVEGTRYAHHVESVDSGHGAEEIPHIRAYSACMPVDDFAQFIIAVVNFVRQH